MNNKLEGILIVLLIIGIISLSLFWVMNKQNSTSSFLNNESVKQKGKGLDSKETNNSLSKPDVGTSYLNSSSFAVIADPHMDEQSDGELYKQTLQNIVNSKPAFLVDLGDTFMVDKLVVKSEENIRERYVLMKSFYDRLGTIPIYFVVGNHDGEAGWDSLNTKNYRFEYFPDQRSERNYYSFEKDNTLFIMLDPYTYTLKKPNQDGWGWTLGKTQYDWLKETLESSKAKFKFIFIHQLVGGDNQGRGGTELAELYEWGGNNLDGSYGFDTQRPGWGKPIHQLLVNNGVNIVFKGHDHLYAKQELDRIIYQTLPQPSHPGDKINQYGYINGEIIGGSGYLLVKTSEADVKVEFFGAEGNIETSYSLSAFN